MLVSDFQLMFTLTAKSAEFRFEERKSGKQGPDFQKRVFFIYKIRKRRRLVVLSLSPFNVSFPK